MWSDEQQHPRGDEGVALIAALLAVMILLGLSIVFVATAVFQQRSTGLARDYESAIHVAEAASDQLIPAINADVDEFFTVDGDNDPHEMAVGLTAAQERAVVMQYALDAPAADLFDLPIGQGYAIRPLQDGEPMGAIFAVGWVPSRDNPLRQRVVKIQFDTLRFSPDVGLLVGGDLTFGGNAKVTGTAGSVHSNGDADSQAGNFSYSQDFTATGTVSQSVCDAVPAGGECYGGAAPRPVPQISSAYAYTLRGQAAADWFDLCPPGHPDADRPTVRLPSAAPCTGVEAEWDHESESFNGWRWQNGAWRTQNAHPGVYFAHRSNAHIQGTTGSGRQPVTVIASATSSDAGGAAGNIFVAGNPKIESALSGMTLIADRDVRLGGTAEFEGLIGAHEQIDIPGTVTIFGAVIAEDAPHTPGSPVEKSRVTGTMEITYDGDLDVPLSGVIRITHWNELRN